ncbi:FAD-dependent oxidoreductase [Streptomyces sp. BBFR51]|uniref:FAD-dependent oxidoreductase n=1 Tax=Streptomyces sp. BBFR51 TaxID=3372856 RepID=UPI0037DDBD61
MTYGSGSPSLKVLICGGGVAGQALAHWLARGGHRVTVVERFPSLRATGAQVDLRGQGIDAVERMGLLDAVRSRLVVRVRDHARSGSSPTSPTARATSSTSWWARTGRARAHGGPSCRPVLLIRTGGWGSTWPTGSSRASRRTAASGTPTTRPAAG